MRLNWVNHKLKLTDFNVFRVESLMMDQKEQNILNVVIAKMFRVLSTIVQASNVYADATNVSMNWWISEIILLIARNAKNLTVDFANKK